MDTLSLHILPGTLLNSGAMSKVLPLLLLSCLLYAADAPKPIVLPAARMFDGKSAEGFTTIRDVGAHGFLDVALRNAIANGKVPGPRMQASVHAIGATGGHYDDDSNLRYGLLPLTDNVDTPQLTHAELDALVDKAHALRPKTAAHAHGATGAKRAICAGIEPLDSLKSATGINAEFLGLTKSIGMLEPGKLVDIVAVPGGPAKDITVIQKVKFEMKERVVYRRD